MLRACNGRSRKRRGITDVVLDIWYFFQGLSKEKRRCKIAADMYYKIVRAFGGSHFEKRDHNYCKSTCADKHGSPYEDLYWAWILILAKSDWNKLFRVNQIDYFKSRAFWHRFRILKRVCRYLEVQCSNDLAVALSFKNTAESGVKCKELG